MNRTIALLHLVQMCGTIDGRKKLQKIVHILKEAGYPFGYRYGFHLHGPFSAELKGDIDLLQADDLIAEHESPIGGYTQYSYAATPSGNQLLQETEPPGEPEWLPLARELNGKSPQQLEAISTVIYLRRHPLGPKSIEERFRALKPQLVNLFGEATAFADRVVPARN